MAEPILSIQGLQKSFGGVTATDNVHLDVLDGETHAVIGPNGAGGRAVQSLAFLARLLAVP